MTPAPRPPPHHSCPELFHPLSETLAMLNTNSSSSPPRSPGNHHSTSVSKDLTT